MTLDSSSTPDVTLTPTVSDPLFHIGESGKVTWANPAAVALIARHADPVLGATALNLFPDAFGATFNRECARAMKFGVESRFEEQYLPQNTWLAVHLYPDGAGVTVLVHDAADRRRDADLMEDHARALEQIARGRPMAAVLAAVTALVERHGNGLLAAVFAEGAGDPRTGRATLNVAAGPSLPPEFLQAIDRVEIRPDGIPVGMSAFTLKPLIVADLLLEPTDPKFREQAGRHGIRACWTAPIMSSAGARLGVLAVFRREPGRPGPDQARLTQSATNLASIALESQFKAANLRQKEEEYRSIVETMQDALIVADLQGCIVEANPAASVIHGSTYDALLGKQAIELIRPDYHGSVRRLLDEVRQGRSYHTELVCIRRDGSSFPAEVNAAPFSYKGQRHLLAVVRDSTFRKRIEDSLRKTEERLRTVANGAPLVLFSLDKAGAFTLSEGQALASIGLRPGEVVGRNALDLYADFPVIVDNLKLALAGEPRRFRAEVSERVFETLVRPLRSHRGEIVGAVGVSIDTTEQTLTEEALAESEDRFRASFHQSPIGAAHTSLDGVVVRANEPLAALLGVPPQEIVGTRLRDWYAEEPARRQDAETVTRLLDGEITTASTERQLRGAGGTPLNAIVSIALVHSRRGEFKHLVYAVTPVPAR